MLVVVEQILDPQVIEFPMMIEGRAMRNGTLLPSYVYFSEDGPIVGEYAKTMIGRANRPSCQID